MIQLQPRQSWDTAWVNPDHIAGIRIQDDVPCKGAGSKVVIVAPTGLTIARMTHQVAAERAEEIAGGIAAQVEEHQAHALVVNTT